MSLGSFFKKVASNLDFWDVKENQRQNAQIDAEERRRKQAQQAAQNAVHTSAPGPTVSVQPLQNQAQFDIAKPLVKAASQSDYKLEVKPVDDSPAARRARSQAWIDSQQHAQPIKAAGAFDNIPVVGKPLSKVSELVTNTAAEGAKGILGDSSAGETPAAAQAAHQAAVNHQPIPKIAADQAGHEQSVRDQGLGAIKARLLFAAPGAALGKNALLKTANSFGLLGGGYSAAHSLESQNTDGKSAGQIAANTAISTGEGYGTGFLLGAAGKLVSPLVKAVRTAVSPVSDATKNILVNDAINGSKTAATDVVRPSQHVLDTRLSKAPSIPEGPAIDVAYHTQQSAALSRSYDEAVKQAENLPPLRQKQALENLDAEAQAKQKELDDALARGQQPQRPVVSDLTKKTEAPAIIPGAKDSPGVAPSVEISTGIKSTNLPKVPDVTNPIALAKADAGAGIPVNEAPIADFNKAIKVPLQKAEAAPPAVPQVAPTTSEVTQVAQAGELPVPTATPATAEGNTALVSDIQAGKALVDQGVAPLPQASPVAATEQSMADNAAQAARQEVQMGDVSAPNTRQQILKGLDQRGVVEDLAANAPAREPVSLADAENNALQSVRQMGDGDIIQTYQKGAIVDNPQSFYEALHSLNRLDKIDTAALDGATAAQVQQARQGAFEAMSAYAEQSGRGLRTVQVLWDNMPSTMKVESLMKKMAKAGVDEPNQYRQQLVDLIGQTDKYGEALQATEDQLKQLAQDISSGAVDGNSQIVTNQIAQLTQDYDKLLRNKEYAAGDALDFYHSTLPSSPAGQQVADSAKILMLSSPMGRVHDLISTSNVAGIDAIHNAVSAGIGKVYNKVIGAGTVIDQAPKLTKSLEGAGTGLMDTGRALVGDRRVSDFQGAMNRPVSRSGITQSGHVGWDTPLKKVGNMAKNLVLAATELPTHLSQGAASNKLYQFAVQDGEKLGLTGQELKNYAEASQRLQSTAHDFVAKETHLKINNLHRNGVTQALTGVVKNIENAAKGTGWEHIIPNVVNQIAPFTSWVGGNLNRTLTDANVISNANRLRVGIKNGDHQLVADSIARLGVNGGLFTTGLLLAKEGGITDTDANGNNYAGGYFHIGNEFIPTAILGPFAAPILFGAATSRAAEKEGGLTASDAVHIPLSAAGDIIKSLGVTATLGGSNALQAGIANVGSGKTTVEDALPKIAAGAIGQFIPGFTNDMNAVIDQTDANPTHEAPDTKVTHLNPESGRQKTDPIASAVAGLEARIPGLSQDLPRKAGEAAKTLLDRALQGTHQTDVTAADNKAKAQLEKQNTPLTSDAIDQAVKDGDYEAAKRGLQYQLDAYQKDPKGSKSKIAELKDKLTETDLQSQGVPITKEGVQARAEDGNFDAAIKGAQYQLSKLEANKDTPKSKREDAQKDITRLTITRDGNFGPDVMKAYADTSLSDWRAMGNPESEDYDPEAYQALWAYDEALAKAGVSRSTKDGGKQKFSDAKGKGGSGGRGRGGSGVNMKGFTTDIAKQSFEGSSSFTPLKAQAANFGTPDSAIPVLAKVPDYDQSKLKKVTVTKGARL